MKKKAEETIVNNGTVVKPKAPDGGWGWMIVFAMAICHAVYGIVVRSFGVTFIELLNRFEGSATATAWVGALNLLMTGLFAPVVSKLCVLYSCRCVTMVGSFVVLLGFVGTAFAPNLVTIYFTFGLLLGVGMSLIYTPGYIIVVDYFEKKRALAMSLGTVATGFGAFFPPVMLYLFETYGFTGAFVIMAAISLHSLLAGMLYRPISSKKVKQPKESPNELDKDNQESLNDLNRGICGTIKTDEPLNKAVDTWKEKVSALEMEEDLTRRSKEIPSWQTRRDSIFHRIIPKKKLFDLTLIKNFRFVSLSLGNFCNAFNVGVISTCVPVLAMQFGIPITQAVSLITVAGIGTTVGILGLGFIMDFKRIKPYRVLMYVSFLYIVGIASTLNPVTTNFISFVAVQFIRAAFSGFCMSQRATIVSDVVGKQKVANAFGILLVSTSLGYTAGRVIGGVVKDLTGYYDAAFYSAGITTLVGAFIFTFAELYYMHKIQR